jgi:hypothetical protein
METIARPIPYDAPPHLSKGVFIAIVSLAVLIMPWTRKV